MISIGIVLLVIALILYPIAFRGRVISRGQYCQKCRFDLAGSPMGEFSKCPECGQSIASVSDRKTIRRQRSRFGISLATTILFVGIGALWISPPARTKVILGMMPNPVVLWLTDLNTEQALDELVSRTSTTPSTLSQKQWSRAIELGLDYQADRSAAWDMRWGQVLFDAISADQMSDDQIERYITTGIKFDLQVRARIHPNTTQLPNQIYRSQERMEPISGGRTGLILLNQITAYGYAGQSPKYQTELHEYPRYLDIFNDGLKSRGSIGMNEPIQASSGSVLNLYFEYQVMLKRGVDAEPVFDKTIRVERSAEVIDPAIPLVNTVHDDEIAKALFASINMMPIVVTEEFVSRGDGRPLASSSMIMATPSIEFPFVHRIFLVFDDFEAQVGQMTHASYESNGVGGLIMLKPNPRYGFTEDLARKVHGILLDSEHVTVELRTDPLLLFDEPLIEECLGVNIVFENVPIQIVPEYDQYPSFDPDSSIKPTRYESYGVEIKD